MSLLTPASRDQSQESITSGTGDNSVVDSMIDEKRDFGHDQDGRDSHGDNGPDMPVQNQTSPRLGMVSTTSSSAPDSPPDGGWRAWTIVFASHLVVMNTWGFINSFGIFQTFYVSSLQATPSTISWIGSTQIFLLFLAGTLAGRLTDAGYFRIIFALGTMFELLGTLLASFGTTRYALLLVSQGLITGIANGLLFCPCITVLATYFSPQRRALAIGAAASGSATGGVVFPSMARAMIPRYGLPWTLRAFAFVQLATLLVANVLLRTRVPPRPSGPLVDRAAFRDRRYTFYAVGSVFLLEGLFVPFYYLATHATTKVEPPLSYPQSLNLLLLLNAVGAPGRLIPGYLAGKVGPITALIPASLAGSLLVFGWAAVRTATALWVWTALFGFAGGAIQGLFPAALSSLTKDPRRQGTRIGMVFTLVSVSSLTGPPISGALISAMGGRFLGAQIFSGTCLLVGTGLLVAARTSGVDASKGFWHEKV